MTTCVFCSSHDDIAPRYKELARRVGHEIGRRGDTLVFGGIRRGLMRIVAEAAHEAGAPVIGVIPATRRDLAEATHAELNDENIYTDGINERKGRMISLADRFVVLPGGYGTLDELLATITAITFEGLQGKEIVIYNLDGLYDPTLAQLELMRSRGLITASLPPITVRCE